MGLSGSARIFTPEVPEGHNPFLGAQFFRGRTSNNVGVELNGENMGTGWAELSHKGLPLFLVI